MSLVTAYDLACCSVGSGSIPCCLASRRLNLHASCTAGLMQRLLMVSHVARLIQYLVALLRCEFLYMRLALPVPKQRLLMISRVAWLVRSLVALLRGV